MQVRPALDQPTTFMEKSITEKDGELSYSRPALYLSLYKDKEGFRRK